MLKLINKTHDDVCHQTDYVFQTDDNFRIQVTYDDEQNPQRIGRFVICFKNLGVPTTGGLTLEYDAYNNSVEFSTKRMISGSIDKIDDLIAEFTKTKALGNELIQILRSIENGEI